MYLHLGQDFIVNTRDVIGVFDLDTATDAGQKAKITDEFLRHAQQEGAVVDVSGSMPKSFVLTDFPDDTVYIVCTSRRHTFVRIKEESHIKSFGGNFLCDFLTKRYQERVRGRGVPSKHEHL